MKKILITGFEGFVGKNVTAYLQENHNFSLTLIEKSYFSEENWEQDLEQLICESNIILHIGADSNTLNKDVDHMMFYNFYISKKIFDLAEKYKKLVVYSSSAACEGVNGYPSNLYGWTKYLGELYGIKNNSKFVALRYFNVYGPGEEHKGIMSSVAYQAYQQKKFVLFPNNPKRDFVYIEDVVSATVHPIFNEISNGVYHVGSGKSETFEKVLELLEVKYSYSDLESIPDGYQFNTKADHNMFQKGWTPSYYIEDGIKKYKEYLH